jgi:acyl-CoA reductase-like NAD-dependent aldehyde dehydrogenase
MVHFTGGTEIGAEIAATCAKRIARVVLELGGKAAAIVADDADFAEVLPSLLAGMVTYQGQLCVALTRILVSRQRHDELVSQLVAALAQIKIGDPADPGVSYGPMPSERIRSRAQGYIARAVDQGATIAYGGQPPAGRDKGFFLEPALLTNVTNDMEVAQNEIFGPVFAVIPYDDLDDAVRIANDSKYGLASSVYTSSDELAWDVAKRVRVGAFAINGNFPCLTAPYGGVKMSGYGRVAGLEGMLEVTSIKQVAPPS